MTRIYTNHSILSEGVISGIFFFYGQGENTPGKNPAEIQSVKIQVKSGEILVLKN